MLCQCPKLTPLQSRLFASLSGLILLGLVYWTLANPNFAYAAELEIDGSGNLRGGDDHNWHRINSQDVQELESEQGDGEYEHVQVELVRRVTQQSQFSGNNIAMPMNVISGNTTIWKFPSTLLTQNATDRGPGLPSELQGKRSVHGVHAELRKRDEEDGESSLEPRQAGRTIYISATTCSQPTWIGASGQSVAPPQLTLYVSNTSGNKNLGSSGAQSQQSVYRFEEGFVRATIPNASGDWYVAVSAPPIASNFTGQWNYEIAASIDGFFHAAEPDTSFLFLVDTDVDSALLVTDNLTESDPSSQVYQQWMNLSAPFIMFASNGNISSLQGVTSSFCGLQNVANSYAQIQGAQSDLEGSTTHVQMGMINRGLGNKPKEQFYITNLNRSSSYQGFLAMDGNSTRSGNGVVGGGGKVWGPVNFTTKADGNCQLLFNLSFCNEVAYAVPSNPNTKPLFSDLQQFYDNYTSYWWTQFNYSLAQIPCNTTPEAQYSLARNCTQCAAAYKEWMCAVSIPRCEDFSNMSPWLQVRNVGQPFYDNNSMLPDEFLLSNYVPMDRAPTIQGSTAYEQTYNWSFATNQSRNLQIDAEIRPGPYKEVLPCEDLCYSLMQSCSSSLQFVCPYPGRGLEASYGKRSTNGQVTCSYLGAVYYLNDAVDGFGVPFLRVMVFAAITAAILAFF